MFPVRRGCLKKCMEAQYQFSVYDASHEKIGQEDIEKAIRDELAAIAQARDEGKSEGIIEGESQNTIKIAKKMLEKQIDIALIMEITGLTKEEIEKL